jgi:thiol-disulfide isomerase/thioredoxin
MFSKQSLFWLIAVVFVLVSVVSQPGLAYLGAGQIAPNFTLTDHFTNENVSLYDCADHIIVLAFFEFYCEPCQIASSELQPYIQEYYDNLGGNPSSIPIKLISINMQDNDEELTNVYVDYFDLKTVWEDPSQISYGQYSRGGIPLFVIINGAAGANYDQWEIVRIQEGYDSGLYNSFRTTIDSVGGPTGSLKTTITTFEALVLGAKWNVDGGPWQSSGVTVSGLSPGMHTINYRTLDEGWMADSEQVNILIEQTVQLTGTYKKIADINEDGYINLLDYAMLAAKWQFVGPCREDLDFDGIVGPGDLQFLAKHWLEPKIMPGLADAYVQRGTYADTNFGYGIALITKNATDPNQTRQSYLRFNYEDQDAAVVRNATLTLTPIITEQGQTLRIRLVDDADDAWYEGGINWNNRPTTSGLEVTFSSDDLVVNEPYSIDVTSLLTQANNKNEIATFHIDTSPENSDGMNIFASRENPTTDLRPVFKVNQIQLGDVNGDSAVNLIDLSLLSSQWHGTGSADIAPDGGDGIVDLIDLKVIAENWLCRITN